MCFAYGTPVGVPDGSRPIERCRVDDVVLAASAGGGGWEWRQDRIVFSDGTSPSRWGPEQSMISLAFGDGGELIVTPDQPVLLAGGRLRRAERLRPRFDRLVAAWGGEVDLHDSSIVRFAGGIHSIATDYGRGGGLDGHLIACGGVICGDFVLQGRGGGEELAHLFAPD